MNTYEKIAENRAYIKSMTKDLEKNAIAAAIIRGGLSLAKRLGGKVKSNPMKSLGIAGGAYEIGSAGAGAAKRNREMKTMSRVNARLGNVSPY